MTTRQEQIAALLVPDWAERDPRDPCSKSIRLRSLNQCSCGTPSHPCHRGRGYLYVTETGEILSGHTRREAQSIGPQTRRQMLGQW